MKSASSKNLVVSLIENKILHIHIKPHAEVTLNDAAFAVEAMGKLGGGKKYPVLIDAGEYISIDKEVRIFSASKESNIYTMADAIAYCNLGQKLMADFYVNYNKPAIPTKVFSNKSEALAWLNTFVNN